MTEAGNPSLLDRLRAKAEALRAAESTAREPIERAQREMDRCLRHAFRWLEEALALLEVIRPTVTRQFRLRGVLTLDRPRYDGGFVVLRRQGLNEHESIDHLAVYYQLAGTEPVIVRAKIGEAAAIRDALRTSALHFRYETEEDEKKVLRYGVFHVEPAIAASIRFEPSYGRHVILVTLSNVDRFESVRLEFRPDRFDESTLEDLVRLMLGESDRFLHRAPLPLTNLQRG